MCTQIFVRLGDASRKGLNSLPDRHPGRQYDAVTGISVFYMSVNALVVGKYESAIGSFLSMDRHGSQKFDSTALMDPDAETKTKSRVGGVPIHSEGT
jgi:hypothetical protein